MAKRIGIEVSLAVAEAVKMARTDVIAAYPITPQTHIVEELSTYVADGNMDAVYIPVESEHSAISASLGAATAGARVFTSSSSQGLALMHEILFIVSSLRMPMVMCVVNRALSGPINIWNDHGDVMAERDIGWVQIFGEDGQESFDLTLCAYKIGEDKRVLLPVTVNIDGFILSHMIEPIEFPEQEEVDKFLPPYEPQLKLDVHKPAMIGPVGTPEIYTEAKMQWEEAVKASKSVVKEVLDDFGKAFGRHYKLIEKNGKENAKTIFVSMGSMGETTMTAVDNLIEAGEDLGQVRIRLWRPFPTEEFLEACAGAEKIIVLDRALSPGAICGPVASEIKSAFYENKNAPEIVNVVVGLGGRDVSVKEFEEIYHKAVKGQLAGSGYTIWGVRTNAAG